MKAPFAYFGGKMGMAARIVAMLPEHRIYMEPFFGSGAVLFAKPPSLFEIVNDLDDTVVTFFRVLRERRAELELVCALSPHSRTEFRAAQVGIDQTDDELERARLFWVMVNQSFAKTSSHNTGWSITTARSTSVPATIVSRLGRFGPAVERLSQVSIENCDAAGLIDRLATADTVIYADPPYLGTTRVQRGDQASDYRCDTSTDVAHRQLHDVLADTPAKVILSGYPSPLYEDLYADWNRVDHQVTSFSSNANTSVRGGRTEVLWTNFDVRPGPQSELFEAFA